MEVGSGSGFNEWDESSVGGRVLAHLYKGLVGDDADWADQRADGFDWWPFRQAQRITVTPYHGGAEYGASIRIATEVRRDVPDSDAAHAAVADVNSGLGQSALVLGEDGSLDLVCRVFVHDGIEWWAKNWAQIVAGDQLIIARELGEKLAELGAPATSGHPRSGERAEPDGLFSLREDYLVPAASKVRHGWRPLVFLLAVTGQYALPYQLDCDDEGVFEFTWHPSGSRMPVAVDPAVRVTVQVADIGCGPGWLVASHLPLTGKNAERARWCNAGNTEFLASPDGRDFTMVGGFGLGDSGECVLSTWMSPIFVDDSTANAVGLLNGLLRYHQGIVGQVLCEPTAPVDATSITPAELADGLKSVVRTFWATLGDFPEDHGYRVSAGNDFAAITLTGSSHDEEPLAQLTWHEGSGGDDEGGEEEAGSFNVRTDLSIPCGYNRPELSLLYAALLAHSEARPAEQDGIPSVRALNLVLGELEEEGTLRGAGDGRWYFDVDGSEAVLVIGSTRYGRGPLSSALRMYDSYALQFTGVASGDMDPPDGGIGDALIGSWFGTPDGDTGYEVVIPPTNLVWVTEYMECEALDWVIRHVIERVQSAIARHRSAASPQRDSSQE